MGCKASRPQPKPGKVRRRALSLEATTGNLRQNSEYRDLEGKTAATGIAGIVSNDSRQGVDYRAATYHDAQDSSQKAMISSEASESMKVAPPSTMNATRPQLTTQGTVEAPTSQQMPSGQSAGPVVPVNLANIPHTPYPGLGQPVQPQQQQRYYPQYPQQPQQPRQQAIPVAVPTDATQNPQRHNSEFARNVREHQRIAPLPPGATVPEYDYKQRTEIPQHTQHRRETSQQPRNRHDKHRHHRRRKHQKHHRRLLNEDDTLYEVGTVMPTVDVDYTDDFYRRKGLAPQSLVATFNDKPTQSNGASVGIREEAPKFTAS
uniref:ZM domain-containing protein n=1 Tax=Panagrellus redivivus TaxID=6233 RepID=A0A7E4WAZ9_PANRE